MPIAYPYINKSLHGVVIGKDLPMKSSSYLNDVTMISDLTGLDLDYKIHSLHSIHLYTKEVIYYATSSLLVHIELVMILWLSGVIKTLKHHKHHQTFS